jgi:hypothetical protein
MKQPPMALIERVYACYWQDEVAARLDYEQFACIHLAAL